MQPAKSPGRQLGHVRSREEPVLVLRADVHEFPESVVVELEKFVLLQLADHPRQTEVGIFLVRISASSNVAMHSPKPSLLEYFGRVPRRGPDSWGKWSSALIEGESLEGVLDIRFDVGIDKSIFLGRPLRYEPDPGDTKRSAYTSRQFWRNLFP